MIETQPEKRDMPIWVSVGLVLVCLLGGGAFVWWYWSEDGPTPRTVVTGREVVDPEIQARQQRERMERRAAVARRAAVEAPDGITTRSRRSWRVKSGDAHMDITRRQREFHYDFTYIAANFGTPEERRLGIVLWRLRNDQAAAQNLGLTTEQVEQLQALPSDNTIQMDPDARQRLVALWEAWHEASDEAKPAAEQELLAALRQVARQSRPATERALAERAERVREILTAEQLEQFAAMGR